MTAARMENFARSAKKKKTQGEMFSVVMLSEGKKWDVNLYQIEKTTQNNFNKAGFPMN